MSKNKKKPSKQKSFFFKDYLESENLFDTLSDKSIKIVPTRVSFLFYIFLSLILIFSIKIIYLSLFPEKNLSLEKINKSFQKKRADIIDRNGVILARNVDIYSAGIRPKLTKDKKKLLINLRLVFPNLDTKSIKKKLNSNNFFYIKKRLTEEERTKLWLLGDKSIVFEKKQMRIYPQQDLLSHVLGQIDDNNNGISGLEKFFDKILKSKKNINSSLKLTIDSNLQYIIKKELKNEKNNFKQVGSAALLMNVNNGEILSLVSLPDFDPNHPTNIKAFTENNLATEARYEMGSTLKIFNAALAFENNLNLENKKFKIGEGYQITSEKLIEDKHILQEELSFDEIFTQSSNVGSVQLIEEIGIRKQQIFLSKLGLNEKINLQGLSTVNNKLPDDWDHLASKFISYGYGISISPISLVSAYSTLVNGGIKIKPTIILNSDRVQKKILSESTSLKVNNLLKKVVNYGTGKKAKVNGLDVGGKTGTSRKLEEGKYSEKKVITSFIGTFPINKPKYIAFVLFDEPRRNTEEFLENFGGNTAAPTFSRIVRKVSPILNKNNYLKSY